jgi:integrase
MARVRTRRAQGYSVYPRKDGRWGWAVTIGTNASGNPQRIQGICRTQADATNKALDTVAKHKAGSHIPQGRDITLETYLDQWLDLYVKPHREPKTVAYYSGMIKHHIVPVLGRTPMRRLTSIQVQRLLNEKAQPFTVTVKDGTTIQKRLSGETIRGIRATLRSALTRAHQDGLVSENVASRVITPKTTRKDPDYLTAEEINTLVSKAIGHPLERIVLLTLLTGMRIGEATGLRWQDVDFDRNTIRIQVQLQRIEGKLTLKGLKSPKANRTLRS